MKNRPVDLNNHLFAALEKLSDDELVGEELEVECKRAQAMAKIGNVIVANYKVVLDAQKALQDKDVEIPDFLKDKSIPGQIEEKKYDR